MQFGSLFSSIGGIDLGLERAGMDCVWQVEKDPWCRRVLAKHWPAVRRFEDVRNFPPEAPQMQVDLICGGFPCQPVSCAGKRKAESDERWLWPEFRRVLREIRPEWVIVENVPGLLTRGAGGVLFDLAHLGYAAEWRVLSAAEFGAPHLRKRVFIVAYSNCLGIHLEPGWFAGAGREGAVYVDRHGSVRTVANSNCERLEKWQGIAGDSQQECEAIEISGLAGPGFWTTEPGVGRVADGVPARVDRLRGLGNAVVPQVAEWIGRQILKAK